MVEVVMGILYVESVVGLTEPVWVAVTGQTVVLTTIVSVVTQVELAGHEVTVDGQAVMVDVRVV
jgi:hypothetical protein